MPLELPLNLPLASARPSLLVVRVTNLKIQVLQVLSSKGAASAQRAKALLAHYKPGAASASAAATAASNAAGMLIASFLCPLPSDHVTGACQLMRVLDYTFCWCVYTCERLCLHVQLQRWACCLAAAALGHLPMALDMRARQ